MSEQDPLLPTSNAQNAENRLVSQSPPPGTRYQRAKARTAEFLESDPLHYLVITLVLIDSACVLADLTYTFLSEDCTPIEGPDAPWWLGVLAHVSLAITTLFLVEIPASIWALGARKFNPFSGQPHAALHFFDAIVIITTFVLEVILRGRERELASLLVVLRLWRLVKLVQGIAVSAGELQEEQASALADTQEELKQALLSLQETRAENKQLRARLSRYEGDEDGQARDEL
ncbi:transporter [Ganoderma sinense ZZ0214-1]|uniref:Transporter n=1 Tax=Ganoderma sinense ZZ0214-1 TaxID=1077348 RepID=A0A2G8RRK7_9APHY|nr:transporter [Ganoderma sinense ZZ0214-1]